ncbi:hypothetical protein BHM03_00004663 [Ensete ventricosum]|uniref:C2 domain-containing protein n=1 Tax=Ensete ventricosum TaxID=4639 RepID=A0A427AX13_ENSVE|nr:hypothetical protein B296_00012962 [Ensete ventricosum]RZR79089.1 hypothetical protein BHM03_00004663 [Ensete ventricosum]
MRKCFTVYGACGVPCGKPDNHRGVSKIITSDPYVSVCVSGATIAQTRVIPNSENPKWEEHFRVPVAHPASKIEFQVKDNDVFGAQLIGVAAIPVDKILSGETVSGWFPVVDPSGNSTKPYPELHFSLQFRNIEQNPLYKDGVGAGPNYAGVPNAYFPLHNQGSVTLYQDAHVPDNMLPNVALDEGKTYEQNKCWEDICHAIVEAHHLIYVIGWSVYHRVKLIREPTKPVPNGGELSLGELLKYKTQEGVRVFWLDIDVTVNCFQIFRSIDSGSVKGFPKHVHEAEGKYFLLQNLVCAKNLKIDKSIHSAYVKAIRSAQHFIYIENQYFVGSSYHWPTYKNAGMYHLCLCDIK